MDSLTAASVRTTLPPANFLPTWALSRRDDWTEADAAFAAGITLKSLDDLVRMEPAWSVAGAHARRSNAPPSPFG